ncbi:MAG: peptidase M16 [Chloroflexi bacterium]|nr:peptidase M16 [Chloroflexota bacterium]
MTNIHGFELIKEEDIPEINTKARHFRHLKSGAELLSLENDDENKVFSANFRTPPKTSNGVPHILEHSVLAGSEKYPVKEPFVELLKGSLQTFVNAFTGPDITFYPCASQNLQDFYNLIDVYVDAVFHPLLPKHILDQEGWHYELENADEQMIYKGVVFNEMKGAYSDPNRILGNASQFSLFPGHIYGLSSGGDPKVIPDLSYEDFIAFHKAYYHPSNSRIVFYGDDDPNERLRLMDSYLSGYELAPAQSTIPLHPHTDSSQEITLPYAASDAEAKCYLTLNWLLPEQGDAERLFSFNILEHILLGSPAAPLRKALIESGLGEDLAGIGLEDEMRQMYFSTGLKGINKDDAQKVTDLIEETLANLANNDIDADTVAASMNTVEFRLRENNSGGFPRGISTLLRAMRFWNYDYDPIAPLAFEAPLNAIKERLASGEKYFEGLIQSHFVANKHKTRVLLVPDTELNRRDEEAEREKLASIQKEMSSEEIEEVIRSTTALIEIQNAPDSPEALATLPTLKREDLDKKNKPIPISEEKISDVTVLYHDLATNGIFYMGMGFDLHALPEDLLPYTTLLGRALVEMGTEKEDFVKLSQRIGRDTGGIRPSAFTSTIWESNESAAYLFLHGKSTVEQASKLTEILKDVLLDTKLDNAERFKQIVLEEKAGLESALIPSGHMVVHGRLRSKFHEAGWLEEKMEGIDFLFFLRELAEKIENDWQSVLADLELVRELLVNQNNLLFNITCEAKAWRETRLQIKELVLALPKSKVHYLKWSPDFGRDPEGLTIPAQVNYVGKGANLYYQGYSLNGSIGAVTRYLGMTWLWEKVRVQGGAYGGFSVFDQKSGLFNYLSYRDPNLLQTLENYDGTGEFLKDLELSDEELTKIIIGAIGGLDTYRLPDAKGHTSMTRYLTHISDEFLQKYRDEVLAATQDDFKDFGVSLNKAKDVGHVVVLGSEDAIKEANEKLDKDKKLNVIKVM